MSEEEEMEEILRVRDGSREERRGEKGGKRVEKLRK